MDKEKLLKYRQEDRKEGREETYRVEKVVDENFIALCKIISTANESFRVKTPWGEITFSRFKTGTTFIE